MHCRTLQWLQKEYSVILEKGKKERVAEMAGKIAKFLWDAIRHPYCVQIESDS